MTVAVLVGWSWWLTIPVVVFVVAVAGLSAPIFHYWPFIDAPGPVAEPKLLGGIDTERVRHEEAERRLRRQLGADGGDG